MSTEIQTESDLRVKYIRGERENMDVEMMEDSKQAEPHSEKKPPALRRSSFRMFTVSLGVLYLLILTGFVIRYFLENTEKHKLSIFSEQLETKFNNLSNSYNQSQNEVKQLQDQITDSEVKYRQLLSQYETLNKTHKQIQDEVKQLLEKNVKCPEGWKRFGWSCYFKSTQRKHWYQSRENCQSRGSDLVIINSKEEHEFIIGLSMNEESWIGLRIKQKDWEPTWEWVDGSPLTEMFWPTGWSQYLTGWKFGACCDQQGKWTQSEYDYDKKWICKKMISYSCS
ncbi:CD209 antigen-like protein E isoform X1 [Channa argus]|uniref:CD209 antigen-like protein E isoform X1 n=1 Tax=Channa argus TaxID=215402 RepID=UPI003522B008